MDGTTKLINKRIVLRRESVEDIPILFEELGCKSEITRYTEWNPYRTIELATEKVNEDIRNYDILGCYSWVIEFQNKVIGTIGAYDYNAEDSSIEIGYSIFKNSWGNGFASEAVLTVVEYLIENEKIHAINAWCHSDNYASIKVLEKANFKVMDIEKQVIRNSDDSLSDRIIMGLVADKK